MALAPLVSRNARQLTLHPRREETPYDMCLRTVSLYKTMHGSLTSAMHALVVSYCYPVGLTL